ncbi:MAG: hypothetical protein NTW95_04230 [Candidatus Aminicenantes bacterium]|nr:hypothetical protein [Candidatus Aminicenantes bacterium]
MQIRKVCSWSLLIACYGFLNAQIGMLEEPLTVMEKTELKIERGECLVYWKPVYCIFPGSGYQLEVLNGTKKGNTKVRSYSVNLDGLDVQAGSKPQDPAANWQGAIHLEGRSILRVKLHGQPGEGITMRIWGEAGKVHSSHMIGSPQAIDISPQIVPGSGSYGSVQAQNKLPQQAPLVKKPEHPQPVVALHADKKSIRIGKLVRLSWDVQNAATVDFTSGDLGRVDKSGSALVWPEKDALFRIEDQDWGNIAAAEVTAKVEVPAPELNLKIKPTTVISGQEVTMTWNTRNARMVRYGDKLYSHLPLSGEKSFKPTRSFSYTVQAENGAKTVQKTISVTVLEREAEQQRIEREEIRRNIPKDIDKTLRGIWDDLKAALQGGDAEKAASFFCIGDRDKYLAMYTEMKDKLPQIGTEMRKIEFLSYEKGGAKYRTKRKETLQGKEFDISYYVYFIIDLDGQWRILRF